jgi:hypothetical protein
VREKKNLFTFTPSSVLRLYKSFIRKTANELPHRMVLTECFYSYNQKQKQKQKKKKKQLQIQIQIQIQN